MDYAVTVETVAPRILAAVRRRVKMGEVPTAFRPPLDQVWAFLKHHPGLRTDGHNVFLYHHVPDPAAGMDVDFGVQVVRQFPAEGDITCAETPACTAAVIQHRGPYSELAAAHAALHRWCRDNGRRIGGWSWEIYGDWHTDPNHLETTIVYALA
jgi:effector-binding domain-containing protein